MGDKGDPGQAQRGMPVRAWLGHVTPVMESHEQRKCRIALAHSWVHGCLPEQEFPCDPGVWRERARDAVWSYRALCALCLSLTFLLTVVGGYAHAQIAQPSNEPVAAPAVPGFFEPIPTPQERLLAPVPQQFNWLEREVLSNPLLEGLLSLQSPRLLTVSASLTEEVSDSFGDGQGNRGVGSRTGVNVGTVLRLDDGQNFVSLANSLRAFYQTRRDRTEVGYTNLALTAGYQLPPWSFGLSESFVRDDDSFQDDETLPNFRTQGRGRFLRNRVSPQVRYDITPRTAATLTYSNILVVEEEGAQGKRMSHIVDTGINHQFSTDLVGSASYSFTTGDTRGESTGLSSISSEGHSHRMSANLFYTYNFDAVTSGTLRVFGTLIEQSEKQGRLSRVYGASIGARRQLFSTVSLFGSVGPTVFKRHGGDEQVRANWQLSLDGPIPIFATPSLSLTVTTQQNVQDSVGEIDDSGLVLRSIASIRLNYTPSAFFTGGLFATYTRSETLEESTTANVSRGRTDNLFSTGVTASYALTNVITLTGTYRYQRRESSQAGDDFDENRVTLAVSGTFPIF